MILKKFECTSFKDRFAVKKCILLLDYFNFKYDLPLGKLYIMNNFDNVGVLTK